MPGTTQKEILRALLTAGSEHCSRIALFVVKAGVATGWQSRGFGEDEVVKDFSLDMTAGPVSHAYQNRVATPGNIAEMDARFVEQFGGPANEQVLVLPLGLKEKVAAIGLCRWRRQRNDGFCRAGIAGSGDQRMAGSHFAAQAGRTERG